MAEDEIYHAQMFHIVAEQSKALNYELDGWTDYAYQLENVSISKASYMH